MKKKTHSYAKSSYSPAKLSNDIAKMPTSLAKKPGLVQEAAAMLESCRYMALHPSDASKMEMERSDVGFKTGALWLIAAYIALLAVVAILVITSPTMSVTGENGQLMEVPKMVIFIVLGPLACLDRTLMLLLVLIFVHLAAGMFGGKGSLGRMFHLLARAMLFLMPLWLVTNIIDGYLPGLLVGATNYSLGHLSLDALLVIMIAAMAPVVYGISRQKAIIIGILYCGLSIIASAVISAMAVSAVPVA